MKRWRRLFLTLLVMSVAYGATMHALIMSKWSTQIDEKATTLIVLGARVRGSDITLSLLERCRTAVAYMKQHPETTAILAGGQGDGEAISEAEAMRRYFVAHGIANERLTLEAKSTSTDENFAFSREITTAKHVIVVTNRYHLFRATFIAERYGFIPSQLAAETPWLSVPKSYLREYLALPKSYFLDRAITKANVND